MVRNTPDWPETVPILGASDMCIGPNKVGKCGCLAAWNWDVFDGSGDDVLLSVARALGQAHIDLKTVVAPDVDVNAGMRECVNFETFECHEGRITRSLAARVWNRAMAILGYVVNNPECTKAGKLKPV